MEHCSRRFPHTVLNRHRHSSYLGAVASLWNVYTLPCENGNNYYTNFFIFLFLHSTVTVTLDVLVAVLTTRGAIMDVDARKHVPLMLYCRVLLSIDEGLSAISDAYWTVKYSSKPYETCKISDESTVVAQGISFGNTILIVLYATFARFVFQTATADEDRGIWEERHKLLFCSSNDGHAYDGIAELLVSPFCDVDLAQSDVASGLLLLDHSTRRVVYFFSFNCHKRPAIQKM